MSATLITGVSWAIAGMCLPHDGRCVSFAVTGIGISRREVGMVSACVLKMRSG